MSTHAPIPGPWTPKNSRHGGYAVECRGRLTNPSSTAVCSVRVFPKTLEAHAEAAATARLIAAAPNMLAKLKWIAARISRDSGSPKFSSNEHDHICDVIAEAEGES